MMMIECVYLNTYSLQVEELERAKIYHQIIIYFNTGKQNASIKSANYPSLGQSV